MEYTAILNDILVGFYRSKYIDADGNEKYIGTTQFQYTDARRAFPCLDEPDIKAYFKVWFIIFKLRISQNLNLSQVEWVMHFNNNSHRIELRWQLVQS